MRKIVEIFPGLKQIRVIKRLSELRDFRIEEVHLTVLPDVVLRRMSER